MRVVPQQAAAVEQLLHVLHRLDAFGRRERRLLSGLVDDRPAVLEEELGVLERVRAHLHLVLVGFAVAVRVFGHGLGDLDELVPRGGNLEPLGFQDVLPVVEGVGVEVVCQGDLVALVGHGVDGALGVLGVDGRAVEFFARDLGQVGQKVLGGVGRHPRHVDRGQVGRRVRRERGRQLLLEGVVVIDLVIDFDSRVLLLVRLDGGFHRRRRAVVVPDDDRVRVGVVARTGGEARARHCTCGDHRRCDRPFAVSPHVRSSWLR